MQLRRTDIVESEVLPFLSEEDQFIRDFLDEAYPVVMGERSHGGSPESTSIIDLSTNMSVDSVCQNIRIYLARLHIIALSCPHISSTTRDAVNIVRRFCEHILQDPNIFGFGGKNKMLEAMSAQQWKTYLGSIENISHECERIDSHNQGLTTWGDNIQLFVTIEQLQREICISEDGSAVFVGDHDFIQNWFRDKFGINFSEAKRIIFSLGDLQYPDEIAHIEALPGTLNDFFQQIILWAQKNINALCEGCDGEGLSLVKIKEKLDRNLGGQFWLSEMYGVYDLSETKLMATIRERFRELGEIYTYFPRFENNICETVTHA